MYKTVHTGLPSSKHGINKDGAHSGITPEQREVPLFRIQPNIRGRGDTDETFPRLWIAPTVFKLLNVPIPGTMKYPALI